MKYFIILITICNFPLIGLSKMKCDYFLNNLLKEYKYIKSKKIGELKIQIYKSKTQDSSSVIVEESLNQLDLIIESTSNINGGKKVSNVYKKSFELLDKETCLPKSVSLSSVSFDKNGEKKMALLKNLWVIFNKI